ncbi:MAG: cysteine desulfurase [Oscillospiraceae bacterium]|nr:cysteine desulfurase [Oscillospiraceae bacterium]
MTVYFDNAATTRVRPEAAELMVRLMCEDYGNPSSTHGLGRAAAAELSAARKKVASALGCGEGEVFFTSGGTESDNWAILGGVYNMRHRGRHIISSAAEHDAVRRPLERLRDQGYEITFLAPDRAGRITAEAVEAALRPDTVLVSLMLVNNETGAVSPIREIADTLKRAKSEALLHTDAVQGFLKVPFSARTLGADMISVSAHKIHGPKGTGALYIKTGLKLPPFHMGGSQEKGLRAGTEALPAIAAFGECARLGAEEFREATENMRRVRDRVRLRLTSALPETVFIGEGDAPHILSLSLPGYKSEVLMNLLDSEGICVSKSSACKKGARSHVLEAMGLGNKVIDGAIRASFSRYSTLEEADCFADRLTQAAKRLVKAL